jgi:3-hydroxyisobutyrate dehydrogenase-like beta-hydroxyacid dehydrogenase
MTMADTSNLGVASSNGAANTVDVAALRIALIGYGEVGGIFGAALAVRGVRGICAFDILQDDPARGQALRARAQCDRVDIAPTAAAAVADADLVICAVTASATRTAAASVAGALKPGAFLLDVNSASPQTKSACGALVAAAGGRYVEAAVMTSVPPYGIRVPMLLGGPDAVAALPSLATLGLAASVASTTLGVASAIKMCRSVIVKGMEAIVIESFLTARRYGVEAEVLGSLAETFPGIDWETQGSYFWQRVVQHGRRRAEEMRESAATVREAGLEPFMADAIAGRQAWVAMLAADGVFAGAPPDADWRALADRIAREELPPA